MDAYHGLLDGWLGASKSTRSSDGAGNMPMKVRRVSITTREYCNVHATHLWNPRLCDTVSVVCGRPLRCSWIAGARLVKGSCGGGSAARCCGPISTDGASGCTTNEVPGTGRCPIAWDR